VAGEAEAQLEIAQELPRVPDRTPEVAFAGTEIIERREGIARKLKADQGMHEKHLVGGRMFACGRSEDACRTPSLQRRLGVTPLFSQHFLYDLIRRARSFSAEAVRRQRTMARDVRSP
jgi:hypothetical protein